MERLSDLVQEYRVAINSILFFFIFYYMGALLGLANSAKAKDHTKDQDLP